MTEKSELNKCTHCGNIHEGLPTDQGYSLPDDVFSLTYLDKFLRTRSNSDLCVLDELRYFIRGILYIPFQNKERSFGWGIWVEVSKDKQELYIDKFDDNCFDIPRFPGIIANDIPAYERTGGIEVEVQLGDKDDRPSFIVKADSSHLLMYEQQNGISDKRHHDILEAVGYFENEK